MITKKQIMMFGVIAAAIASFGVSTTLIEAEKNTTIPTRSFDDPFSFGLPEPESLRAVYSDTSKSTPFAYLAKSDHKALPILIKAKGDKESTIKFYATYGNQRDDIKIPDGMSIKVVPNEISLKPGESKIINLEVTTNGNTRDAMYIMNIVGEYGEHPNDFKGTAVKLIVGQGDNKFTLPYGE